MCIHNWSERRTDLLVVTIATIMAAVLSLLFIGDKSLWIDEGASIYFAHDGASMWQKLVHREANMWLYYILLNLWLRLGDSESFARAFSALFATAAVPLVYVLGRRLFGSRAGAIAALLLASHSCLIRYAQEVRDYTLLVFLVALSSYFFVRAVDKGSRGGWVGHGVAMGLAIHAHFFAALAYFTQMITVGLIGRIASCWRGLLLSAAILAAFLVPILLLQPLGGDQIQWVPPFALGHLYPFFLQMTGSRLLLLLYLVFCVVALISSPRKRTDGARSPERWHYLFVSAWILVPMATAAVVSVLIKPVFVDRYLIASVPPLALLAGAGMARVRPQWLCVPVLLVCLYGSARCLKGWYCTDEWDDWRSATTYVLSQARTGDGAVFHVPNGRQCFDYYRRDLGDTPSPTALDVTLETSQMQIDRALLSSLSLTYDRIWLILANASAPGNSSNTTQILNYLDSHYALQLEHEFTGVKVRLYQREEPASGPQEPGPSGTLSRSLANGGAL